MPDRATSSPRSRIVFLWPGRNGQEEWAAELGDSRAETVFVGCGYEAAAEILADGATALVVDLRLLGARHLPLLDLAARNGTAVFATGSVHPGTSAEQLSGVRLAAQDDLPDLLAELLAENAPPRSRTAPNPKEASAPPARGPSAEIPARASSARNPGGLRRPGEPPPAPAPANGQYQSEGRANRSPAARGAGEPDADGDARSVLTPEELAALLEDEA